MIRVGHAFKSTSNPQYSEFIALSRYCRWDESKNRRETWDEVCDRVVSFWVKRFPEQKEIINECFDAQRKLELVGSMRANMTAGPALERDEVAGYNCSYTTISGEGETITFEHDKLDAPVVVHLKKPIDFDEMMYILMCVAPNTKVRTSDGLKTISSLTLDDEVASFNTKDNIIEYIKPNSVTETMSFSPDKIELEFENGHILQCTPNHKILTGRGWVEAKDLKTSDDIKNIEEL